MIIFTTIISFFLLFIIHIIVIRLYILFKITIKSPQMLLIKTIISTNILIFLILLILKFEIDEVIYVILSFILFSYSYFHLFNMSETARRIRILVSIFKNEAFKEDYNKESMINLRLERLENMQQIIKLNDKYILKGKTLFIITQVMKCFKNLLIVSPIKN